MIEIHVACWHHDPVVVADGDEEELREAFPEFPEWEFVYGAYSVILGRFPDTSEGLEEAHLYAAKMSQRAGVLYPYLED